MKFKFRMRFSSATPIEVDISAEFEAKAYADQLKEALRVLLEAHKKWRNGDKEGSRAYLSGANLSEVNLSGAYLSGVNLSGAKVTDKVGNIIVVTRAPLILHGLGYPVMVWDRHMQIGCEMHSLADWRAFDDRAIAAMDGVLALKFWAAHKGALLALAESDGRGAETEISAKGE